MAVAYILKAHYGFTKIILNHTNDSPIRIIDQSWQHLYPFLDRPLSERFAVIMYNNICLEDYFQYSIPLVEHRDMILQNFRTDTSIVSRQGYTLKEFATSVSPIALDPDDIVLHVRLGDFIVSNYIDFKSGFVIDPAPQIAILRRELRKRLIIVCAKPTTDMEHNYLKLFEEFHPVIHHGTELEDFGILRNANRIMVTNSTFSWMAAYMGHAKSRWIPMATYNDLEKIEEADILYDAATGYNTASLGIPTEPFLPVTGEFLQSLCDYTIIDKEIKESFHVNIDSAHPPERQMFIEDEWPAEIFQATSLFIFPSLGGKIARHVFKHSWPNLKLIIFHNSDYGVDYNSVFPFLEHNPKVWCWAENAIDRHPRIKVVPIGEENRMWRGGNPVYEPSVEASRATNRDLNIIAPYWSITNPIRNVWNAQLALRDDIIILPKLNKQEYLDTVSRSRAMICPPGNGIDTHRHWDALRQGAWAVVEENDHSLFLMETYPSLHLILVKDMTSPITIPPGLPPFHPVLLRAYWRTLFKSHIL